MLGFKTRLVCGAALVFVLGCGDEAPSKPITGTKTHADDADGGEDHGHNDVVTNHPMAVGNAGSHGSDKPDNDAGMEDHAKDMPAKPTPDKGKAGSGGAASSDKSHGGTGGSKSADKNEGGVGGNAAGQGGAGGSGDDQGDDGDKGDDKGDDGSQAGAGAAGSGGMRDPLDVLRDLAKRTPQGMAAEVIRRFLNDLGSGDTPASSIQDFLHSIDEEAHCTQMISQECLAACSVVTRTCGVCVLDMDCRSELQKVCGLGALACGR